MTTLGQRQVLDLIAKFSGQANVLTIPRVYIDWAGGHIPALLLSQVLYWTSRTPDPDGWFYKSAKEWGEELGISDYQLAQATKKLAAAGLETRLRKVAGAPTLHYRLDPEAFSKWISEKLGNHGTPISEKLGNGFPSQSDDDSRETRGTYTETTAETTAERDGSGPTRIRPEEFVPDPQDPERVAAAIGDVAAALRDEAHPDHTTRRAWEGYVAAGVGFDAWLGAVDYARRMALRTWTTGAESRMPAFWRALEGRLGERAGERRTA